MIPWQTHAGNINLDRISIINTFNSSKGFCGIFCWGTVCSSVSRIYLKRLVKLLMHLNCRKMRRIPRLHVFSVTFFSGTYTLFSQIIQKECFFPPVFDRDRMFRIIRRSKLPWIPISLAKFGESRMKTSQNKHCSKILQETLLNSVSYDFLGRTISHDSFHTAECQGTVLLFQHCQWVIQVLCTGGTLNQTWVLISNMFCVHKWVTS
jgi:hypothetical protein